MPSMITVHAPQSPFSHPGFDPVNPSCSRNAVNNVSAFLITICLSSPLIRKLTCLIMASLLQMYESYRAIGCVTKRSETRKKHADLPRREEGASLLRHRFDLPLLGSDC